VRRYTEVLLEVLTLARWRKICRQAVTDAETGDKIARKWVGDYVLGRVIEHEAFDEGGDESMTLAEMERRADERMKEAENVDCDGSMGHRRERANLDDEEDAILSS